MSYILDALRKADQQRRRGAAPTLLTLQPSAVVRKRPAYLKYGLLAVVLIGAGVVIGWLRPWQAQQVVPASVAVKPIESKPIEPKPIEARPLESKPGQPAPAASESPAQPTAELPAPAKPQADGLPSAATAPVPGRAAAPPERRVDIAAADAAGETVIAIEKLPLSIREGLPKMTVSVHAYSDTPEKRLVGIGSRILREGDYVVPGLQLEEITPDGMILSYRGYRFRRGVK
jgi:general secretion pathway protein B